MAGVAKFNPDIGDIFQSKQFGRFEILELYPSVRKENGKGYYGRSAKVRFIDTGYETIARLDHVSKGEVKDKLYPGVYGVGCIGYMDEFYSDNSREYNLWCNMLSRCYNPNDNRYNTYGGAGVKVCDRWLRFEYFFHDLPNIPGYDIWVLNDTKNPYHLDKDTLQQGIPDYMKVYSPETCMFVPARENINEMNLRYNDRFNNLYHGVYYNKGSIEVYVTMNGKYTYVSRFTSEIAAAVYRDWFCMANNIPCILNFNPLYRPMTIYEAMMYEVKSHRNDLNHAPRPMSDFYGGQMCLVDNVPRYREMCRVVEK